MTSLLPLRGKTALITGGTRGVGEGIVLELAKRGANVIFTYSSARSYHLALKLEGRVVNLPHKPSCLALKCDLRDPFEIMTTVGRAINDIKRDNSYYDNTKPFSAQIDILVNNARVEHSGLMSSITPEEFNLVFNINVRGALILTQKIIPHLPNKGRIINISYIGARAGSDYMQLSCSSKAALEGLTRAWAAELGWNGTTVNAVNHGPVQSNNLAHIPEFVVNTQRSAAPLERRAGTVEEIAAVAWLASDDSSWVTGQCISACGGLAMY